jgi:CRP-like cAMP-binding protein
MPAEILPSYSNRILSRLSAEDLALLKPHHTAVELPVRKQIEVPRKVIEHVYFPESGVVSVVANGDNKRGIEVGLVGRDGMTGLAIVMGKSNTPPQLCSDRGAWSQDHCG